MNISRRIVSIVLLVSLLLGIPATTLGTPQANINILLDEEKVSLEDEIITNEINQIMLPLREIAEKLEYKVNWDGNTRSITLSKGSQIIELKIGETKVDVNGEILVLKSPPILKETKTFVPMELFSNALGLVIGWNGKHQVLKINQPEEKNESFFTISKDKDKQAELDAYIKALEKHQNFHGSVFVAKDGEVLLNKGYGFADFEQNTNNISQTKFAIGSITKQFTAMAIMQLNEKGLLSVEDKISKYFPDFPNGDSITIHNLLTHTSGLTNYTNLSEFLDIDLNNKDPMKTIELIKNLPLEFEPGKEFSYSNTNYVLLGMIVENITDISLEDYLQKNIFTPLNMSNTGSYYIENNQFPDATPYTGFLEIYPVDDELVLTQAYGAGNIYSTVEDLYRWDRALSTEQLVKKETLDKIFTEYITMPGAGSYGYGWMIADTDMGRQIFHGGNTMGFTANIARYPEKDLVVIILTNSAYYDTTSLTNALTSIVLDKDYEMPEVLKEIEIEDPNLYDNYIGKYEFIDGTYINITKIEDKLYAQVTGQNAFEILPLSNNRFFAKDVDIRIEFIKDEEEKITELVLEQLGMTFVCKRVEDIEEKKEIEIDPKVYDNYVGEYELAPNVIIKITKEDNSLYAQLTGQDKFEIFPESEEEFFYKVVDAKITFQKDDTGNVTHLILYQNAQEIPANKIK
ncbi:Predicted beta-lactamase [[Clostridium] ultunense Esp]|uniref:Predicted beta-lactamase n=1 Tax=[Clostridium] ultunense Esp TaxID=1288971 RepID=M1ZDA6_9FIRM|nr:serine hydrolase [Schnuerera ultunensis]CCQ95883.1 Predicted beta-lactamase [[Clostridium] ultunense Esp]SHD78009.1 Predicted beta-lactamase [[Clostridium] ultunense Esp]